MPCSGVILCTPAYDRAPSAPGGWQTGPCRDGCPSTRAISGSGRSRSKRSTRASRWRSGHRRTARSTSSALLAAEHGGLRRSGRRLVQGDPVTEGPAAQDAAAAVQHRGPDVGQRAAGVGQPAPVPVQAAEGVLNHVLGRRPVAEHVVGQPDQAHGHQRGTAPRPPPRLRGPGRGQEPVPFLPIQYYGAPRNRSGLLAPCKLRRSARPPAARRIARPPTGCVAPHDRRYLLLGYGEDTKRDRDGEELAGLDTFLWAGPGEVPLNYVPRLRSVAGRP